jgi:hypothetical protein
MNEQPSNGESSAATRLRVMTTLDVAMVALRELRDTDDFWLALGPAYRIRYEDFQADLASARISWRG